MIYFYSLIFVKLATWGTEFDVYVATNGKNIRLEKLYMLGFLGLNAGHDCWKRYRSLRLVSVWYLATQLQKIVNILLNEATFSPHQFIFISVSSGWWKVAVGCGGLAERDASEPFCGRTSHGRITLKYIHALMFHTFTAVNLWMSAIIHG